MQSRLRERSRDIFCEMELANDGYSAGHMPPDTARISPVM